jgi:hypothetical protein
MGKGEERGKKRRGGERENYLVCDYLQVTEICKKLKFNIRLNNSSRYLAKINKNICPYKSFYQDVYSSIIHKQKSKTSQINW